MSRRLSILNPNPRKLSGPDNLHNLVANDGCEGKPAIKYALPSGDVESLTYDQLHRKANSLARVIRSKLSLPSTSKLPRLIVPIFIQQCPLLYISQLATLQAGAAFCPLTLDVPEDRLRFILNDVQATVLLTTSELRGNLPGLDSISVISVDDFDSDSGTEILPDHVDPSSPAYVMYTSGSTGQPKGVVLSHSAATQALLAHDCHIPEFSRFLQFASPTFDVSVFEIFFPLYRGRTLICGERRQLLNDLPGFINAMNIDAAELTPSVASNLLRGREKLPSLKLLLTIGEMLKRDVIEEYGGSSPGRSILYGMYGPTEATIHCTLQSRFTSDMPAGNIGVPLDPVSAFVVKPITEDGPRNDEVEILAVGELGELAVGGYQLADGYLNRPEQTKAAFVKHPEFGNLYRTGDRVRLTEDGMLECLGRISSGQVKLRGQRIELGEIEYAVVQTPGCQTAVAEIVAGSLIVFCVCSSQGSDEDRIRQTCRKWLPTFMVPADILILDHLPYLESGKVDRKGLQAIYQSKKAQVDGTVDEKDENMRSIVEVISKVLGVELHAETSLMAAGMDSLSSIRISAELNRAGFARLDALEIIESRTARDVDAQLRKRISVVESRPRRDPPDGPSSAADAVRKYSMLADRSDEIDYIYPSTITQSSMLLETARRSHAYCNWIEFESSGVLDANEISVSLRKLAVAHGLLRSGFIASDEFESGHAVVTWRELHSTQVRLVQDFAYEYSVQDEENLLRPCAFQIKSCNNETRILLQIHHALYDQWSVDVLRRDLHDILQGNELPPRPSFEVISGYHHKFFNTSQAEDNLDFWADLLRDFNATPIPALISRRIPARLERTTWYSLDCDLNQFRARAKELQCSVPAIFQSAVAYLLGSYVASTDVTLGVVLSGRHISVNGIEGVFGPCFSILPLRLDHSTVRTVAELTRLVQTTNRAMQKHSLTPLVEIKNTVKDLGHTQLFDSLFVWQESTICAQESELSIREIDSADQHEYNLVLEFEPTGNDIRMRATFQQALLSCDQIKLMIAQIQYYVEYIVNNSDGLVQDMNNCLPVSALSISNLRPEDCATGHNLVEAIEEHARALPSTPAIIFANSFEHFKPNTTSVTYQELNERSNQVARLIRSRSASESNPVCIFMDKSIDLYVTILGSIKAGFGYLPIIPDTPLARVKSIFHQANISLCICDDKTHDDLEGTQGVLTVNCTKFDLSEFDATNLNINFPHDRVAYTVFTSGSTGEPKGVPVTMRSLLGNLQALSELYSTRGGDRLLQACSHAFDVSVFEILYTFYNGLCLCSAPKEVLFEDFVLSIRQFGITHLSLTPTVAALVDPADVPTVRFLVTAGEAVTNTVHSKWAGRGLHQGYGPSETTNICSVNMDASHEDALGNIGPPLRNTSAFVISTAPEFNILPAGALGEFAFGGEQVFPGYIGQAGLNESKIIQHPQYGRIYRSGDLGRILPDGSMLIQGRLDDQVKVRGNRIELGEINSMLLRDGDIHDCTTLIIGSDAATQSIGSFVATTILWSDPIDEATRMRRDDLVNQLFQALEDSLPSYMVPNTITIIDDMPRTSQGKLDHRALRKLLHSQESTLAATFERQSQSEDRQANWSENEIKIVHVLAHVLNIESSKITRRVSLFSFGLNSLNAISFAKKLSQELNTRVSVATVLDNPNIGRLVRAIEPKPNDKLTNGHHDEPELLPPQLVKSIEASLPFSEQDVEWILPCTPLQEAMLCGSVVTSEKAYWNTLALRLHCDIRKMKHCWEQMAERHAILRTRFVSTDDREHPYAQIVLGNAKLIWYEKEQSSGDSTSHSRILLTGTEQDLAHSAPFYIECVVANDNTSIVLHMHHAVYDGVSISRLLAEVQSVYDGHKLHSVASFGEFLQEAQKHRGQDAMSFWSGELQDFLPRPMPRVSSGAGSTEHTMQNTLPNAVSELDRLCRHHSINQLAIFQTALVKTLAACQNITDVCFGNIVSGRTIPVEGVEDLVAPCFNTIPVRINLQKNASNVSTASQLHRKNIVSLRHQLTPLRRIQQYSRSPEKHLFECLLILQPPERHLDANVWTLVEETGDMDLPLVFELLPTEDEFKLILHYSHEFVSDTDAACLWNAFAAAVTSCLKYPSGNIRDFSGSDSSRIAGLLATNEQQNAAANGIDTADSSECSEEEGLVCDTFAQLANLPRGSIKRGTSMFQIGLDSLNAPRIAMKLRAAGLDVDAGDVLESLTPAAIAIRAQEKLTFEPRRIVDLHQFDRKHRRKVLKSVRTSTSAIESVWPCTPIQSGMILQSIQSQGELYINHITYNVPSDISNNDIQAAWRRLTAKYQVLRMGFHKIDDTRIPFAMSVFTPASASNPFFEHDEKLPIRRVEQQASEIIMRSINRHAWCVQTMRQNDDLLMTLSLHHALYDAASLEAILNAFAKAMALVDLGSPVNIEHAVVANLNASLHKSKAQSDFWSSALESASASKFPDLAPILVNSKELEYKDYELNVSLEDVEDFCKTHDATIQALGQTVWGILLSAYVGDDNVVFGTIFSGHPTQSAENVPFPSITTIPVACDNSCSALETLSRMVRFNASAYRHRFTPLAEIQRLTGSNNGTLLDTVFVHQRASQSSFNWKVVAERAAVDYTASLELQISQQRSINLRLTYRIDRVPSHQASLILQQYEHILKELMSEQGKQPTSLFSILPARQPEIPEDAHLLHQMVERSLSKHPDRIALTFIRRSGERKLSVSWTYSELNERANQVANLIVEAAVSPRSIVAVCMEKCPDASFAFLGILKAGCSFLAVDPDLPKARLEFILQDSNAELLFVNEGMHKSLQQDGIQYIEIHSTVLDHYSKCPVDNVNVSPEATCYCLYTSGTTGTPKGCEITHENAVQAMKSFQRLFAGHWTEHSRWLQFASYWFDVSVLEQFWSWGVGIEVVGAPRDVVLEDLPGFIAEQKITHIDLTPSLARLVQPEDVPSLWGGVFITGGEALKQEIIDAWGPKKAICNGYGPTEATIGVTMNTFVGTDAKPSNIGRQFDNVGAFVLKPNTDWPVLRGAVGELCVSGKLVGKGYLNRPDLTDSQFPTLDEFRERIYRTGDLVRVLADGSFSFVGRKDSQAKLRGQRLETSEVDSVIQNSSDHASYAATLIAKAGPTNKETLVSYLTKTAIHCERELKIDLSDHGLKIGKAAREACAAHLPGYMVPTHILPINYLPLTVNNKVDTKRLVRLFAESTSKDLQTLSGSGSGETFSSLSSSEESVRNALSELLSIEPHDIAAESNLFSVGLSSISAIPFATLLKRKGFKRANVAVVMSNPTIRQLNAAISRLTRGNQESNDSVAQAQLSLSAFSQRHYSLAARSLGISVDEIEAVAPCTPLQQGVILDSMRLEHHPYFNDFTYVLDEVDVLRLENAFQQLVAHAQILRTCFLDTDQGTAQVVRKQVRIAIAKHQVAKSTDPTTHLDELKLRWIKKNNDMLVRPFEVNLIRAENRHLLRIHIHHALYDGISFDLLLRTLCDLYTGKCLDNSGPTFISALPYGPLRQLSPAKSFWQKRLGGWTRTPIPRSQERQRPETVFASNTINGSSLEATRKHLGVSHQAMVQSCFEIALARWKPAIREYGMIVSGRSIELAGADKVIGPMFNTVPLMLHALPNSTFGQHTRARHDDNTVILPYQHTPLKDIRKWAGQNAVEPMFDVLFVFQHASSQTNESITALMKEVASEQQAHYPLCCEIELYDSGGMRVLLLAQDDYFDQEAVQSLVDLIARALQCLSHSPNLTLGEGFGIMNENSNQVERDRTHHDNQLNGVQHFEWTQSAVAIRTAIASLLNLDQGGIDEHSTIFALGLDSIDAVKLASRLRKSGLLVPVSKLLKAQTIPRILEAAETGNPKVSDSKNISKTSKIEAQLATLIPTLSTLDPNNIEAVLPATPTQEALLAAMHRTQMREYFNHDILRLRHGTDLSRLRQAWQRVIDHSAVLRSVFIEVSDPEIDTAFAQVVLRRYQKWPNVHECDSIDDLRALLDTARLEVAHTLDSQPPTRVSCIKVKEERYMIVSLSHAQYDGHSLALIHDDVHRAYYDCFTPRPTYNLALEASLTAVDDEALRFWQDTLSNVAPVPFPRTNTDADTIQTYRAETSTAITTLSAREFCKAHAVSMQALAQTCWALTLAHYIRRTEVTFGVVLACRDSKEAEEVMFPTMNTVTLRALLHGTRAEMVQDLQSLGIEMLPYQRTPLRAIRAAVSNTLRPAKQCPENGLFDTLFIYQSRPSKQYDPGEPLYDSVGGSSDVEYPVAVEIEAAEGESVLIRAACRSSVLDELGTEQLIETVEEVLMALIDSPNEPTVDFDGQEVSICGMESFYLEEGRHNSENSETDDAGSNADVDTSSAIDAIVEGLSHISKVPKVDITASSTIESIGIDSISAIKVAALLRRRDIHLTVSEILQAKTPVRMAQSAKSNEPSKSKREQVSRETISSAVLAYVDNDLLRRSAIDPSNVETVMPATSGQIYMISMWWKTQGQLFYPTFKYQLEGDIEVKAVKQAWKVLVNRHCILRTVFCATGDTSMPALQVVLRRDAASGIQPMVSLHIEKNDRGCELSLSIHHAMYDAVSLPLLIQDLESLLANKSLSNLALSFKDFIAPSTLHRSKQLRKHFWSEYLDDINPHSLKQPESDGQQRKVEIFKPNLVRGITDIEKAARTQNLSLQSILFAAYAKVYASLAASSDVEPKDVVLGIYLSNRLHISDLETLAAPTVNLVPLLVRSPWQNGVGKLAKQIHEDLQKIGGMENSAVGMWEVEQWTGVRVDTFVNFLKLPESSQEDWEEQGGVRLKPVDCERLERRSRVVDPDNIGAFEVAKELEGMRGMDAYKDSLDIEMTVTDNDLAVGLFGPESMVNLDQAERALTEFKALMEEFAVNST